MTERTPVIAHCRPYGHVWAAVWLPLVITETSRLMRAGCPACGTRKGVFIATAEQATAWRDGPRGEPCFVKEGAAS